MLTFGDKREASVLSKKAVPEKKSYATTAHNEDIQSLLQSGRLPSNNTFTPFSNLQLNTACMNTLTKHYLFPIGDVHLHTGAYANQENAKRGSKAFTKGTDVYFSENQFEINSKQGRHLLAHELVHTAQQTNTDAEARSLNTEQAEVQANMAANRVVNGMPPGNIGRATHGAVQMQLRDSPGVSASREEYLRDLARYPYNFAGLPGRPSWQRLSENERSVVILAMDVYYGTRFTNAFVRYANAGRLRGPGFVTSHRSSSTLGELAPSRLSSEGWALAARQPLAAGTPRASEEWVHPSGGPHHYWTTSRRREIGRASCRERV